MNAKHKIPDMSKPFKIQGLIQYFESIRAFSGVIDNPITMDVIEGWQRHIGITLLKWERDCVFLMDKALRHSYYDVLKYHAQRKQVKHLIPKGQ